MRVLKLLKCLGHLIEENGIEQPCRCVTRPAISDERLSISREGNAVLKLKTPWRNGTTHIVFDRSVGAG